MAGLLEHIKTVSQEVEKWPEWKKNQLGAEYVNTDHLNFEMKEEEDGEPEYDSPDGSVWIVSVDFNGAVSILDAPNIHYSFFDMGYDPETIGLPFETELPPGVYRWTCILNSTKDWESGIVDDYEFEVVEEELLWSLENLKEESK